MTDRTLVLRGTVMGWLQYGMAVLTTLVLTPIVLDHLGPAGYGVWLAVSQLVGYAGVLDLGVSPAVIRYVSAARGANDWPRIRTIIGTAGRLHALIGAICLPLGVLLAAGAERWLDLGGIPPGQVRRTILLAAVAAGLGFPTMVVTGALRGFQRFDAASGAAVLSQLARAVAVLTAVCLGAGLPGLAAANVAGGLAALAIGSILLRRLTGFWIGTLRAHSRDALRILLSYGTYSVFGALGYQLAYASDTILVGAALTAVEAARFGVAVSVLALTSASVGAFTGNLMPLVSTYQSRGEEERAARAYLIGTRIAATLALPQLAILYLEGSAMLRLWLSGEIATPVGANLRMLVFAYVPSLLNAASLPLALGLGLHRRAAGLLAGEGVAKIALALLLIPWLGAPGVAVATLAAGAAFQGWLWPSILRRQLGLPLGRWLRDAVLPPLLPTFLLVLVLLAWRPPVDTQGLLLRWSVIGMGVLIYWARATLSLRAASRQSEQL